MQGDNTIDFRGIGIFQSGKQQNTGIIYQNIHSRPHLSHPIVDFLSYARLRQIGIHGYCGYSELFDEHIRDAYIFIGTIAYDDNIMPACSQLAGIFQSDTR